MGRGTTLILFLHSLIMYFILFLFILIFHLRHHNHSQYNRKPHHHHGTTTTTTTMFWHLWKPVTSTTPKLLYLGPLGHTEAADSPGHNLSRCVEICGERTKRMSLYKSRSNILTGHLQQRDTNHGTKDRMCLRCTRVWDLVIYETKNRRRVGQRARERGKRKNVTYYLHDSYDSWWWRLRLQIQFHPQRYAPLGTALMITRDLGGCTVYRSDLGALHSAHVKCAPGAPQFDHRNGCGC